MEEPAATGNVDWAPDEIRRFLRAYQKYGGDFHKISKTVGGGKAPEMCHALWQKHQAFLTTDRRFVTEQSFLAKVQEVDGAQTNDPDRFEAPDIPVDEDDPEKHWETTDGGAGDDREEEKDDISDIEADIVEAVVSMASPQKGIVAKDREKEEASVSVGRLERQRRTPKRLTDVSPGRKTPNSASRRSRNAQYSKRKADGDGEDDGDGIYEYYDDAIFSISESARKRQRVRSRLQYANDNKNNNHNDNNSPSPGKQKTSSQRRQEKAEEQRGIVALLALAVAGNDEEGYPDRRLSTTYNKRTKEVEDVEDEETENDEETEDEEDDALGVLLDDDRDEDYRGEGYKGGGSSSRPRRTPQTTPHKSRTHPTSVHATPKSRARSSLTSPIRAKDLLRSPGWLASDLNLMEDADIHNDYKEYPFNSPSFLHHRYPPGFVPSPNNPLPRMRRRKPLPYRHTTRISPIKL